MRFNFFCYIFRNDFIQLVVCFVNLLYAMIDKRYKIRGITNANDHTRAVLGMLQSCTDTESSLFHRLFFKVTIKKGGKKSYNDINDEPDDSFFSHISLLLKSKNNDSYFFVFRAS